MFDLAFILSMSWNNCKEFNETWKLVSVIEFLTITNRHLINEGSGDCLFLLSASMVPKAYTLNCQCCEKNFLTVS